MTHHNPGCLHDVRESLALVIVFMLPWKNNCGLNFKNLLTMSHRLHIHGGHISKLVGPNH